MRRHFPSFVASLSLAFATALWADAGAASPDPFGGARAASPPTKAATIAPGLRLRTHDHQGWFGPAVPGFVPKQLADMKLDLLDRQGTSWIAVYREATFDACGLEKRNCKAEVRIFDESGGELVTLPLNPFLSRRTKLEVQDVRYDGTTVFFNEACQSYSREADGKCSALVAVDPYQKKVVWRTTNLVSNNWFVLAGDYVVSAYGFTGEKAFIRVVRKKDGAIMDTKALPGTNFEMFLSGDDVAVDCWYDIGRVHYRLTGQDGPAPKLTRR
ncbi:MAG: hypothetical protein JST00_27725 [Deltaproteobacteria bacterium]|nr:hypothetical protein [Deltaproteobacteria bacterium]